MYVCTNFHGNASNATVGKTLLQPQGVSFNFATLSGTTEMLHEIEYDVKY